MYTPSFIKIGTSDQAILRFCLRNLRGCSVGITDGRDLLITLLRKLRCRDKRKKFIKIGSGILKLIGGYTDSKVIL
jgi:hypothetical protein